MLHASTQKLIIKLCELTTLGDIQWREGRDGAVVFETEGYAVEVLGQPAKLRVLNSDGNELEHVDTDSLAAAPWPDGEGSFAYHVSTMAAQAHRLARGTDHAISRILSSLSAPSAAARAPETTQQIETHDESQPSAAGGPESEAAMAAAVADMAIRLNQSPLEDAQEPPPAAAADTQPAAPESSATPETQPRSTHAIIEHARRSTETFGRTRSFAVAGRTHHRPSPEARPVSSLGKTTANSATASGMSAGNQEQADTHPTQPEPEAEPAALAPPAPETPIASAPRTLPAPTPPDAYKPWV